MSSSCSTSLVTLRLHFLSCRRSVVQRCTTMAAPADGEAPSFPGLAERLHEATGVARLGQRIWWSRVLGQVSNGTQPLVRVPIGVLDTGSSRSSNLIDTTFVTARTPHRPSLATQDDTIAARRSRPTTRRPGGERKTGDEAIPSLRMRDRGAKAS